MKPKKKKENPTGAGETQTPRTDYKPSRHSPKATIMVDTVSEFKMPASKNSGFDAMSMSTRTFNRGKGTVTK